jgi:hypothetical protein
MSSYYGKAVTHQTQARHEGGAVVVLLVHGHAIDDGRGLGVGRRRGCFPRMGLGLASMFVVFVLVRTVMLPIVKGASAVTCALLLVATSGSAGLVNQRKEASFGQVCKG